MFQNMCRLCSSKQDLLCVFDEKMSDNMTEIIKVTCGVEISKTDTVSQMVCSTCCKVTIKMFQFRTKSIKNDKDLKARCAGYNVAQLSRAATSFNQNKNEPIPTAYPAIAASVSIRPCITTTSPASVTITSPASVTITSPASVTTPSSSSVTTLSPPSITTRPPPQAIKAKPQIPRYKFAHFSVKEVIKKYPNIKLPVNCLKSHVGAYITLLTDEVDEYYQDRNFTDADIARIKREAYELTNPGQQTLPKKRRKTICEERQRDPRPFSPVGGKKPRMSNERDNRPKSRAGFEKNSPDSNSNALDKMLKVTVENILAEADASTKSDEITVTPETNRKRIREKRLSNKSNSSTDSFQWTFPTNTKAKPASKTVEKPAPKIVENSAPKTAEKPVSLVRPAEKSTYNVNPLDKSNHILKNLLFETPPKSIKEKRDAITLTSLLNVEAVVTSKPQNQDFIIEIDDTTSPFPSRIDVEDGDSRPNSKNSERPKSAVAKNLERSKTAVSKNLEQPKSAISQNLEKPQTTVSKNLEPPKSTVAKNLERPKSALGQKDRALSTRVQPEEFDFFTSRPFVKDFSDPRQNTAKPAEDKNHKNAPTLEMMDTEDSSGSDPLVMDIDSESSTSTKYSDQEKTSFAEALQLAPRVPESSNTPRPENSNMPDFTLLSLVPKSHTLYTCKVCDSQHRSQKELRQHERRTHTKCPFCSKRFRSRANRDEHVATMCVINSSPVKLKRAKLELVKIDQVQEIRQKYASAFKVSTNVELETATEEPATVETATEEVVDVESATEEVVDLETSTEELVVVIEKETEINRKQDENKTEESNKQNQTTTENSGKKEETKKNNENSNAKKNKPNADPKKRSSRNAPNLITVIDLEKEKDDSVECDNATEHAISELEQFLNCPEIISLEKDDGNNAATDVQLPFLAILQSSVGTQQPPTGNQQTPATSNPPPSAGNKEQPSTASEDVICISDEESDPKTSTTTPNKPTKPDEEKLNVVGSDVLNNINLHDNDFNVLKAIFTQNRMRLAMRKQQVAWNLSNDSIEDGSTNRVKIFRNLRKYLHEYKVPIEVQYSNNLIVQYKPRTQPPTKKQSGMWTHLRPTALKPIRTLLPTPVPAKPPPAIKPVPQYTVLNGQIPLVSTLKPTKFPGQASILRHRSPPAQHQPTAVRPSAQPQPTAVRPSAQTQPTTVRPSAQTQPTTGCPSAQTQPTATAVRPSTQTQPTTGRPSAQTQATASRPSAPTQPLSAQTQPQAPRTNVIINNKQNQVDNVTNVQNNDVTTTKYILTPVSIANSSSASLVLNSASVANSSLVYTHPQVSNISTPGVSNSSNVITSSTPTYTNFIILPKSLLTQATMATMSTMVTPSLPVIQSVTGAVEGIPSTSSDQPSITTVAQLESITNSLMPSATMTQTTGSTVVAVADMQPSASAVKVTQPAKNNPQPVNSYAQPAIRVRNLKELS